MPGYVTVLVEAIIEPGVPLGRHTHPGIESAYVLEGGFEPPIQGQPTRTLKVGDAFQIPPETPHAGGKPGDAKSRILLRAYFAVPRYLEFMSELPTTENGKVRKYKLRERGVTQQTWDGGPAGRKGAGRTSA